MHLGIERNQCLWLEIGEIDVPHNSATNNASPMPTGAMKVVRDFSAASIKTTKTSSEVRNVSMNTPWAMEVLFVNRVITAIGPRNMHELRADPREQEGAAGPG